MTPPLIFFDGVCGLCNTAVDWILAHDPEHVFRFAPLQGSTAAQTLNESERADLKSIVLIEEGQAYRKSDAVLRIGRRLPAPWRSLAQIATAVPRPVRDAVYSIIARFRYQIWGKKETCRVPSKEERALFLD